MSENTWKIRYPRELPIAARVDEIRELWRRHPLIIVCGATGSGKTTQLPKLALEVTGDAPGLIGCTQPRRLAATAMASRLARELGVECGREVGYQVRFDDRTVREVTRIKFMTDGVLLAETRSDPNFRRYRALIIDEAHERSLNIDFLLGYLKNLLPRRPDLKIVISSATLDAGKFSAFFDGAPVIEVEGRQYPIEDLFLEPERDEELPDLVGRGVRFLSEYDRKGDILVFLPGEREIREASELLNGWKMPHTEVLPLFGRLGLREQERVFTVGKRRRIVLATNVAETSVTIPGIDYVIDSGLVRLSRYNPRTQVQELQIEPVSQAAARQRRGRCGRVGEGVCLHLYSQETLERSPEYTDPEIKRTALAGVILQMALLRLPRIEHFPFIDPPTGVGIREGRRALLDIGAITEAGALTRDGRRIAQLPLDPHLAKMLLAGASARLSAELLVLTAFLSLQDPRERPLDAQQQADEKHRQWRDERSDFLGILKLWNFLFGGDAKVSGSALRRVCRANFLNYPRIHEWRNLVEELNDALAEADEKGAGDFAFDLDKLPCDLLHQSILAGIPRHVGCYDDEEKCYDGAGGRKFHLFPGSALFRRKKRALWVMSFALVETTRLFARQNAEIRPEFLELVAPHLCKATYDQTHFDPESGFVYARQRLTFGGLLVHGGRRVHYGKSHPAEARAVFIREALAAGAIRSRHPEVRRFLAFFDELARLEIKLRRPGTVVDNEAIFQHFAALLPTEVISQQALERWLDTERPAEWLPTREAAMQTQFRPVVFADYPDELRFDGHVFHLQYVFDPGAELDGVTLSASGEELPLIPRWEPEYLIPGWLPEKVELLLRQLPKERRVRCLPLAETIEAYLENLRSAGDAHTAGLVVSLAEFLSEWTGAEFNWRDFESARLPEHLVMKIAETDAAGKLIELHRELPDAQAHGSRLSRLVPGVAAHVTAAGTQWPSGGFEKSVPLDNGGVAYPALTPEAEGVARQLFLGEAEARRRHTAGLVRLFRLREGGLVKFVRRDLRFSNELRLGMLRNDPQKQYADDLVDAALRRAFGADAWEIRSAAAFDRSVEAVKSGFADCAAELGRTLEEWQALLNGRILPLLGKVEARGAAAAGQVRSQLADYFRVGFLRADDRLERTSRYLRAIELRLGRALNDPVKDEQKAAPLETEFERCRLSLAAGADWVYNCEFVAYWRLVEEARIAALCPELRPLEKTSAARLAAAWNAVKL